MYVKLLEAGMYIHCPIDGLAQSLFVIWMNETVTPWKKNLVGLSIALPPVARKLSGSQ